MYQTQWSHISLPYLKSSRSVKTTIPNVHLGMLIGEDRCATQLGPLEAEHTQFLCLWLVTISKYYTELKGANESNTWDKNVIYFKAFWR